MGCMFLGGAFGSAAVTAAWHAGRWPAVAALGLLLASLATLAQTNNLLQKGGARTSSHS
jgi:hypothetical protein